MTARQTVFSRAAHLEPVERTPVWFMRQAGRILPEYRKVRERWSLIEICRQPELCAEVALQPVRRFEMDAVILFCDIMLPLIGIGIDLELVDNVGPVIREPVRSMNDVARLRPIEPDADVPFVLGTIKEIKKEMGDKLPVIGFSGAPFTLASYLIEGRPTRDFMETKSMMYRAPDVWHAIMDRLTTIMIEYLKAQANVGVDALQLFDTWVGALSPDDYGTFVQPYTRRIFAALKPTGLPFIHFGTNTATLLDQMKDDGGSLIGVDWRIPLDEAWKQVGYDKGMQGNLDPAVLVAPPDILKQRVADVLKRAAGRPGHIFNLGHGVNPNTPLDSVSRVIDYVRELSTVERAERSAPALA